MTLKLTFLAGLVLLVASQTQVGALGQMVYIDVSVCALGAAVAAPAEAEFSSVFRFILDENGRPTNVVSLLGAKFINKSVIGSCLHDWQLRGLKNGQFTVAFYWRNRMWTEAVISGPDFRYRLRRVAGEMPH